MLIEILTELAAIYRRWHAGNRVVSGLVLTAIGVMALHTAWGVLCWMASLTGVGGQRHAVAGRVTWQGKPLENGIISFRPLNQQPFESGALIQNGAFAIPQRNGLTAGAYRVRIHASMADPSLPPPADGERDARPGVELLPPKYNANSELTAEIGGWGRSTVSFDLAP